MKKISRLTNKPVDQPFSSVDQSISPVNQDNKPVDWSLHQSTRNSSQSTTAVLKNILSRRLTNRLHLKRKVSNFKCQKASPTTLNGYILGEVYKRPHMLEFWSTEQEREKLEHSLKARSNPFKLQKEEKRKKAPSLPKIQRASSFTKASPQRKIEVPGSYKSKQRVSIKSKLIFEDFF